MTLNDFIIGGAFLSMATIFGAIYQLICPPTSKSDELQAIAIGFFGGIIGILIASFILNAIQ